MAPRLAERWERCGLVRKRFRNKDPWVRVPTNENDDQDVDADLQMEPSTRFLKRNVSIIRAVYQTYGLRPKPSIPQLEKEVNKLFDLLEFLPQNPKQPYLDAWNIKRLYGFAQRRQKDSKRRGQTPRDRGVRSLFKFIAKIKENGGFPVHFIRAQREESEGGSSDGASAEPEPETSSQAGSEPEAEGTVCDSSSDSPLPVGNSDPSAEAAVTPTTASLDGSGKAESAPVLPASLESPAADNEAKKEVSKPPQKLINLAPSKPVAPTKAWRGPCRDDESDDEVCVVGSFSCQPVAEGTSTSCKASRKEVLEAELRGLRQQLEAKRMEATKKDLPGRRSPEVVAAAAPLPGPMDQVDTLPLTESQADESALGIPKSPVTAPGKRRGYLAGRAFSADLEEPSTSTAPVEPMEETMPHVPGSLADGSAPFDVVAPNLQKQLRTGKGKTCKRGRRRRNSKIWEKAKGNKSKERKGKKVNKIKLDHTMETKAKHAKETVRSVGKRKGVNLDTTAAPSAAKTRKLKNSENAHDPKLAMKIPKDRAAAAAKKAAAKSKPKSRSKPKTGKDSSDPPAGGAPEGHAGCSRCRYAAKGCVTCLNPNFRPRGPRKPRTDGVAGSARDVN